MAVTQLKVIDEQRETIRNAKQAQVLLERKLRTYMQECEMLRMENEKLRVKLAEAKKNSYIS